jgi:ubiquinone/menaquinone biosynthesis C-methylase UbiE
MISKGGQGRELTHKRKESPLSSVNSSPELFDSQAAVFEQRAGLPDVACQEIANAVLEIGEVKACDLVIEIGPGTGQIGQWFGEPVRYAGLDLSAGMLKEFERRLGGNLDNRVLVQADANSSWPVANAAARVIFGSRAMHLLNHEHVASEVLRVASPAGATLLIGRVERAPDSIRACMAREMNERLRRRGFEGRRGEQQNRKLIESCCRRGAKLLESAPVAKWKVLASPRQSLDSWRSIEGLGGIQVSSTTRNEILTELEAWAQDVFGGLDQQFESEETYVLKGLRVPPAH